MASFVPFVPATGVRRAGPDVVAALPDPPRTPGEPIRRPGVARHAGAILVWLPLAPDGAASFPLLAPATGTCRTVTLPAATLPGVTQLLEIAPLPFAVAAVLRRLPGLPTFHLAFATAGSPPEDGALVRAGEVLTTATAAFVGLLFADRVALTPATWVDLVAGAMTGVDTPADVTAWRRLADFAPAGRVLHVRDHVGRPAVGQQVLVTGPAGNAALVTDAAGALPLPGGALELAWQAARPVHALYERSRSAPTERATSTPPGSRLILPADVAGGHLQLLDAAGWFADRAPQLDERLGHVRTDSRLEPLVDGVETFRRMLEDLRAATGPGQGAHFAGWAFNDFPFDLADPNTMFTDLVKALRQGGTTAQADALGARFLMDRYLVFKPDAPTDAIERFLVVLLTLGVDVLLVASVLEKLDIDDRGFLVLGALGLLGGLALGMFGLEPLLRKVEDKIDGSEELAAAFNEVRDGIALRARHPARFVDNPLDFVNPLPFDVSDFIAGVGSWHQKFQVVHRAPDPLGSTVVGYLGGIDMNRNRLDTPGHHGRSWRPPGAGGPPSSQSFHDVHARITGPAAADVAHTFDRRWAFDTTLQPPRPAGSPPPLDVAFTAPLADDVPPQPARHLVQIGRSGYTPAPGGGSTPLPWSPAGEPTVSEAIVRAIGAAREYIYIEDQYFTPHDAYVSALLDAAARDPKLRLVIVIPTSSDQLFGDIRRRAIFERLRDGRTPGTGWGDRMIVGAPVRRPVLADAGRVAAKGRLLLAEPLGDAGGDQEVVLGPRSRLPGAVPFWLWVEGERMLAVEQRDDVAVERPFDHAVHEGDPATESVPCRVYLVRRPSGSEPLWGATTRAHTRWAPVTLSQVRGIYVHTKAIIVDDVFVGIGSCNTNRRGFFHDGEITAFAVPEQLKGSHENPALALRTALWAEHLGIPPAMGPALLADPMAAFELFRRPTLIGNRLSGFDALGVTPELGFPGEAGTLVKMLATFGLTAADGLVPWVWNVLADATTATDPAPVAGPDLGTV